MDFQTVIVALIFLTASVYVGKMIWLKAKSFSKKGSSCGNDCGCEAKKKSKFA